MQDVTVTFEQAMFVFNALMTEAVGAGEMVVDKRNEDVAAGEYDASETDVRMTDAADTAANAAKVMQAMFDTSYEGVKLAVVQDALWSFDTEWRESVLENIEEQAEEQGFAEVLVLCEQYLAWKNEQYAK